MTMDTVLRGVTGMTDLMHATRAEAARIVEVTGGDVVAEHEIILNRLVDAELLRRDEAVALLEIYRTTYEAGEGKRDPARAYLQSRAIFDKLAAHREVTPIAVVIGSAGLGGYTIGAGEDGSTVVTVMRLSYTQSLAGIGAGLGVILGGAVGGALGGQIGGLIGGIIDDKKDKKKT